MPFESLRISMRSAAGSHHHQVLLGLPEIINFTNSEKSDNSTLKITLYLFNNAEVNFYGLSHKQVRWRDVTCAPSRSTTPSPLVSAAFIISSRSSSASFSPRFAMKWRNSKAVMYPSPSLSNTVRAKPWISIKGHVILHLWRHNMYQANNGLLVNTSCEASPWW